MRPLRRRGRTSVTLAAVATLGWVALGGCVSAPYYFQPGNEESAMLVPGFDSATTQLAHWSCPYSDGETKDGFRVTSPAYEIVLIEDPARGMLLHELNNDWVMFKPETIAGGGALFRVGVPGEASEFIVPPDRAQDVTHRFKSVYVGYSEIETKSLTRMCHRSAPVRLL